MAFQKNKNFLPIIFLALVSWIIVGFFLLFVDPELIKDFPLKNTYFIFFFFIFLAIFFSSSLLFINSRRGLLLAIGVVSFLYLRLIGLGHLLNIFLLLSFISVLELAMSRK